MLQIERHDVLARIVRPIHVYHDKSRLYVVKILRGRSGVVQSRTWLIPQGSIT